MRRWNGWGDTSIEFALPEQALAFLGERIGKPSAPSDAALDAVCKSIPPSRLPSHRAVETDATVRLTHGYGQSMPDWLALRYGRIGPVPDGVAFPESTEQVADLLAWASSVGAHVIPYGGGTSVVGHLSVPGGDTPVLSIDMSRMTQLMSLDRDSQLASFGAGVRGPDLESQLRVHGYTLGHFPQSFEYSTLGGWVVTRSSGQQSLRYGRIEQLFAGGRMVTPTGVIEVPAFPASAAGLDIREMLLGSEGRLGVLTEASVRVTPLPEDEQFHAVFFPDWQHAQDAIRTIAQAKVPLSMMRLSNALETLTTLTLAGHGSAIRWLKRYLNLRGCADQMCLLLIGATGTKPAVSHALGQAFALASASKGVRVGRMIGEKWKHNRYRNVYLRNALWEHGYGVDTVETANNWNRVEAGMRAVESAAHTAFAGFGERVHAYTHLSHIYPQGASIYSTFVYRLSGDYDKDLARWRKLKAGVCEAIVASGGTISHQHGVGVDHAPYLKAEKGALGMQAMQALFQQFDPAGIMNPGKLLA